MRTPFIRSGFNPPQKADLGNYYLLPISVRNTIEDWLVLKKNAQTIVQLRGRGSRKDWPFSCSLLENFKDLAWLEICANYRQLFSYIIRNKKDNSYAGCVYIYPIEFFYPELAEKYDIDFSFWITKKEYDKGVYEQIFRDLLNWLIQEWKLPREKIYLRNKEIPDNLK